MTIYRPCRHLFTFLFTCLVLVFLLTAYGEALAQTWYIKPTAEIPLRRGQGSDYKILAIVPDGTAVTILEEEESWAKVVTQDNEEGWILKRYLTTEPPLEDLLKKLQQENQVLEEKVEQLTAENEEITQLNEALEKTLENNQTELASTIDKYQKLEEDTADVVSIKKNLDQSKQTIIKLQQEVGTLSAENKRLKASQNIKWFLAGGGTLIFGCIVGMISSRSKKRKSSLY